MRELAAEDVRLSRAAERHAATPNSLRRKLLGRHRGPVSSGAASSPARSGRGRFRTRIDAAASALLFLAAAHLVA